MNIRKDYTITLDKEEVIKLCRPGEEGNTCIWVVVGPGGFECRYCNRPTGLISRWRQGFTVAKRDGCDEVKKMGLEIKYTEAATLADILGGE